jgi:beta-lactamase class A
MEKEMNALPLQRLNCRYAFYYTRNGGRPFFQWNHDRFFSASIIKVPILLAWLVLERAGVVHRDALCDLDAEPQVQGAGFSWLLRARRLPYQDVLLMMIALSDNLCTNLVIRKAGLGRLNEIIQGELGLRDTALQRKLFDYEARAQGKENWISAQDCIHMYERIEALAPDERAWVDSMLEVCHDTALLKRNIPRDTIPFFHKTGSITGVLHDWGYTDRCKIFLLTQDVQDEPAAFEIFGSMGAWMMVED